MHAHGLRRLPFGSKDFGTVHDGYVRERASRALPDQVVSLDRLRFTDQETVEVPGSGHYELTSWSKMQLASLLGIRWNKWFEESSSREKAEEINRRFARSGETKKLRMSRRPHDIEGRGDGVLRGFLGPKYTPIDDTQVFDAFRETVRMDHVRFVRTAVTDRASQFAGVSGDPVNMGTDKEDWVYPGFILRNSEVGYSSLTIDTFLFRLVCTNGLTVMVEGKRLLYRQHRPIEEEALTTLVAKAFSQQEDLSSLAMQRLGLSRQEPVQEPEREIQQIVRASGLPREMVQAVKDAYFTEPDPTRFGIVQALTRSARSVPPDAGYEIEQLAGRYLTNGINSLRQAA